MPCLVKVTTTIPGFSPGNAADFDRELCEAEAMFPHTFNWTVLVARNEGKEQRLLALCLLVFPRIQIIKIRVEWHNYRLLYCHLNANPLHNPMNITLADLPTLID